MDITGCTQSFTCGCVASNAARNAVASLSISLSLAAVTASYSLLSVIRLSARRWLRCNWCSNVALLVRSWLISLYAVTEMVRSDQVCRAKARRAAKPL